jgi:hypothetical protein
MLFDGAIDKTLDRLAVGGVFRERGIVARAGLEGMVMTVRHDTRGRAMRLFTPLLAIPLLALGLLACAPPTPAGYGPSAKEDRLAAAGFKKRSIKTEAQLTDFSNYPAHMIRPTTYKGKKVYVYADPTICGCLYMGGTTAYNTYIRSATALNMQREYKSETTDSGYLPGPWMLDGGPWDDADMYGLYVD